MVKLWLSRRELKGSISVEDEVQVSKLSWRPGFEELVMEGAPQSSRCRPWINVGFINAQAVATEIELCNPIHVGRSPALF